MRVAVVGGGIGGLATAYLLARQGATVEVYESDHALGGLASAFEYEGVKVERYYHFICRPDAAYLRLLEELGLSSQLRWHPTKMGYFYQGSYYRFGTPFSLLGFSPLSLSSRARFGIAALTSKRMDDWRSLDNVTAKRWLIDTQGRQCFDVVWEPLLEFKFGDRADEVSAAWMWARINRVANSREGVLFREYLGYLLGGTQMLIDTLVGEIERLGGTVRTGAMVERIEIDADRVRGVRVAGETKTADAVVSTVAPPVFLRLADELPPTYAEQLGAIGYYGVACWVLIARDTLSADFWLNINDDRVPYPGIITYTNLNPMPEMGGRHVLYVPMYMSTSDTRFSAAADAMLPDLLEALDTIKPGFSSQVEKATLFRDEYAQPLFDCGASGRFGNLAGVQTPVEGVYRIDMSQIYPDDRSLVNAIAKAYEVASLVGDAG